MVETMHHHVVLVATISFWIFTQATFGQGQSSSGFLNIDCGKPENDTHNETSLVYTSDFPYIDTGQIHNVASLYTSLGFLPNSKDLRSFPDGNRNCYTLKPINKGGRYLVRSIFLYGNYDGQDHSPEFDLYLGVNYWDTVSLSNASDYRYSEIMAVATSNFLSLCLVNIGKGTPFISAIEVRPLPDDFYPLLDSSQALRLQSRKDLGGVSTYRYPYDSIDRIWEPLTGDAYTTISTTSSANISSGYQPPSIVMSTAVTPTSGSSVIFTWDETISRIQKPYNYFLAFHFAELQQLRSNETRIFDIRINDNVWSKQNIQPQYLETTTIHSDKLTTSTSGSFSWSLTMTNGSTLPPIINAKEFYLVMDFSTIETDVEDVDTMVEIKRLYNIKKNWSGDPCLPLEFIWDGLNCSFSNLSSSRIISLNLSSSGLIGGIVSSFGNLIELQNLDLSKNELTGTIPDFLGSLSQLKFLDISGNNLIGPIPEVLRVRVANGTLKLRTDIAELQAKENKKKSLTIIIIAIVCVMCLVLAVFFLYIWMRCHVPAPLNTIEPNTRNEIHSETRKFEYRELEEITRKFEKSIGEGGFGNVYYGVLGDGTEVAVKVLSKASSSGPGQFQNEALLLSKIHHRNLVTLIGHCNEPHHLALVYEYMEEGSLHDHLSGKAPLLYSMGWKKRLEIAIGAAQGLDYLHSGCKPPIIHRDVKPNNILLNKNLEPKISDFGLSKIFENDGQSYITTIVMGTHGYLDPEYHTTQMLREKSDVYSFGIVLLQLATGLPAIIKGEVNVHIVDWVLRWYETGAIVDIIDKRLNGKYHINSAWKMMEVAFACASTKSAERPSMIEVVMQLKDCLELERAHDPENLFVDPREMVSIEMVPKGEEIVTALLPK